MSRKPRPRYGSYGSYEDLNSDSEEGLNGASLNANGAAVMNQLFGAFGAGAQNLLTQNQNFGNLFGGVPQDTELETDDDSNDSDDESEDEPYINDVNREISDVTDQISNEHDDKVAYVSVGPFGGSTGTAFTTKQYTSLGPITGYVITHSSSAISGIGLQFGSKKQFYGSGLESSNHGNAYNSLLKSKNEDITKISVVVGPSKTIDQMQFITTLKEHKAYGISNPEGKKQLIQCGGKPLAYISGRYSEEGITSLTFHFKYSVETICLMKDALPNIEYHTNVFGSLPLNWQCALEVRETAGTMTLPDMESYEKLRSDDDKLAFLMNLLKDLEVLVEEGTLSLEEEIHWFHCLEESGVLLGRKINNEQKTAAFIDKFTYLSTRKQKAGETKKSPLISYEGKPRDKNEFIPPTKIYKANSIYFSDDVHVTDAVLESWYVHLANQFTQGIAAITLRGCTQITDWGVHWLAMLLRGRTGEITVNLDGCSKITEKGLLELCNAGPVLNIWCENTGVASLPESVKKQAHRFNLSNCPLLQISMLGFPEVEQFGSGPYQKVLICNTGLTSESLIHMICENKNKQHDQQVTVSKLCIKDNSKEPVVKDLQGKEATFNMWQVPVMHASYGLLTKGEMNQVIIPFDLDKSVDQISQISANIIAENALKEVVSLSSAMEKVTVQAPAPLWTIHSISKLLLDTSTGIFCSMSEKLEDECDMEEFDAEEVREISFTEYMNSYYNRLELEVLEYRSLHPDFSAEDSAVNLSFLRLNHDFIQKELKQNLKIQKGDKICVIYTEDETYKLLLNDQNVDELEKDPGYGHPTLSVPVYMYVKIKVVNYNTLPQTVPTQSFFDNNLTNQEMFFDASTGTLRYDETMKDENVQLFKGIQPLTKENNSVSVKVLNLGEKSTISIGLVHPRYIPNRQPGWDAGSIAFHLDDNGIFNGSGSADMKVQMPKKVALGDVITLTVDIGDRPYIRQGDTVKITYLLNEKKIVDNKDWTFKCDHWGALVVPAIGLHSAGESVQILNYQSPPLVHQRIAPVLAGADRYLIPGKRNCLMKGDTIFPTANLTAATYAWSKDREYFMADGSLTCAVSSFKVKVAKCQDTSIFSLGLVQRGHSSKRGPGNTEGSIGLVFDKPDDNSTRSSVHSGRRKINKSTQGCSVGDIIECGLVRNTKVVFDEHSFPTPGQTVYVYFSINGSVVFPSEALKYHGGGIYPFVCFGGADIELSLPNLVCYGGKEVVHKPATLPVSPGTQFILAGIAKDDSSGGAWPQVVDKVKAGIIDGLKKNISTASKEKANILQRSKVSLIDHQNLSHLSKMVYNLQNIVRSAESVLHFVKVQPGKNGKEALCESLLRNMKFLILHHEFLYKYTEATVKVLEKIRDLEKNKMMTVQEIEEVVCDEKIGSVFVRKCLERLQQWGLVLVLEDMDPAVVVTNPTWFVNVLNTLPEQAKHKVWPELMCLGQTCPVLSPREIVKNLTDTFEADKLQLLLHVLINNQQVLRLIPFKNEAGEPKYYLVHPLNFKAETPQNWNDTMGKYYGHSTANMNPSNFVTISKAYTFKHGGGALPHVWFSVLCSVTGFCTPVVLRQDLLIWHKGAAEFLLKATMKGFRIRSISLEAKTYLTKSQDHKMLTDVKEYLNATFRIYQDIVDATLLQEGVVFESQTKNLGPYDISGICAGHQWERPSWQSDLSVCTLCDNCCSDGTMCDYNRIIDNHQLTCKCRTTNTPCFDCGLCQACANKLWKFASLLRPGQLNKNEVQRIGTEVHVMSKAPIDAMIVNNFQLRIYKNDEAAYTTSWGLLSEDNEEMIVFMSMCTALKCPDVVYSCPINHGQLAYNSEFFNSVTYANVDSLDVYDVSLFQPKGDNTADLGHTVLHSKDHQQTKWADYDFSSLTRIRFYRNCGTAECESNSWNPNQLTGFMTSKHPLTPDCFYYEIEILNTGSEGYVCAGLKDLEHGIGGYKPIYGYQTTPTESIIGHIEQEKRFLHKSPLHAGDKIGVGVYFNSTDDKHTVFFIKNGEKQNLEITTNKELHGHIVIQGSGWKVRLTTRGVWRAKLEDLHEAIDVKIDASKSEQAWSTYDHLEISPATKLEFRKIDNEPEKVSAELILKAKPHLEHPVLFKVKVTNLNTYIVKPNKGIIKPGETALVTIIGKAVPTNADDTKVVNFEKDKLKLEWKEDKADLSVKNYGTGFGKNKENDGPFSIMDAKWTVAWNNNELPEHNTVLQCKMASAAGKESKNSLDNFVKNIYNMKRHVQDRPKPLPKVTDTWPGHPSYVLEVRKNGKLCSQSWITKKRYYLTSWQLQKQTPLSKVLVKENQFSEVNLKNTGISIPRYPRTVFPNSLRRGMKVYAKFDTKLMNQMQSTYLKDIFPSSTKLDQGLSTKAGSSILKKKSMLSGEGSSLKKKVGIQSKKIIIHESDDESEVKEIPTIFKESSGEEKEVQIMYGPCKIIDVLDGGNRFRLKWDLGLASSSFKWNLDHEVNIDELHSQFLMDHLDAFYTLDLAKTCKGANMVFWEKPQKFSEGDYKWSNERKSENVTLDPGQMTYTRAFVSSSTDGVCGEVGFNSGVHEFRFDYVNAKAPAAGYGSFFQLGVCTEDATVQRGSYGVVFGADENSWGWDIPSNSLYHKGKHVKTAPLNAAKEFSIVMKINIKDRKWPYLHFSMFDKGDDQFGFTAFEGESLADALDAGKKLYPCAAGVYGGHCVKITLISSNRLQAQTTVSNEDWNAIGVYIPTGPTLVYDCVPEPYLFPAEKRQANMFSSNISSKMRETFGKEMFYNFNSPQMNCKNRWLCTVQQREWLKLTDDLTMDDQDYFLPMYTFVPLPKQMDMQTITYTSLNVLMDLANLHMHFLCKPSEFADMKEMCQNSYRLHFVDRPGVVPKNNITEHMMFQFPTLTCLYLASMKVLLPSYKNLIDCGDDIPRKQLEHQIQSMMNLYASVMQVNFAYDLRTTHMEGLTEIDPTEDRGLYIAGLNDNLKTFLPEDVAAKMKLNSEAFMCSSHINASVDSDVVQKQVLDVAVYQPYNELITKLYLKNVTDLQEIPENFQDVFPNLELLQIDEATSLKKLPKEFKKMTKFEVLWILCTLQDNIPLEKLPEDIGELKFLSDIIINRAHIKHLPTSICNVEKIFSISLSSNGLYELPEGIGNMAHLSNLVLNYNRICKLPSGFGNLRCLTTLSLAGVEFMPIKAVFKEKDQFHSWFQNQGIDTMKSLPENRPGELYDQCKETINDSPSTSLHQVNGHLFYEVPRIGLDYIDGDEDGGIPEAIFSLENLESLDLSNQALRFVPPQIARLRKLEQLVLKRNYLLESLPGAMGAMKKLTKINLANCPSLKTPPNEIVGRGTEAVQAFLKRLSGGTTENWRTKLMLVGLGGAGKTSLLQALMNPSHKTKGTSSDEVTDGIDIKTWTVKHSDGMKITFSTWDFAGQDVYYNTHQFFLSGRAVYLLLWTCRLGWEHAGLDFWLSSIQCHAPNAPIFIVGTHCDQVAKAELPSDVLRKKYPQIKGCFYVSSIKGNGIAQLEKEIIEVTRQESYMGESVPTVYLTLESKILQLRKEKSVINWSDVLKLAIECGIFEEKDIKRAMQFLHDLGTVQYFDNEFLRDHVVINPQWIVDVMACVVSVKNSPIQNGRFEHKDISTVWRPYPEDLHEWLLRLTEEFDLTFPVPSQSVNLVPCLLPQIEPQFGWPEVTEGEHETMMLYRFTYLPAGLFNRTQVRLFQFSDSKDIWKRGSLLQKNGHMALLKQLSDKELLVKVQGPRPENVLFLIHEVIESLIMESFHGVTYDYMIPCPDCIAKGGSTSEKALFEASLVKRASERNAPFLQCREHFHTVSMSILQASMPADNTVEFDVHLSQSVRNLEELRSNQPYDIFIHYCNTDIPEPSNDAVIHPRTVVNDLTKAGLKCWYEENINKIDIQEITMALKDSKLVLLFMSDAYEKDKKCRDLFLYSKHTLAKPFQVCAYGEGFAWKTTNLGGMEIGSHHVYVNMTQKPRYKSKIDELKDLVKSKLESLNKESRFQQCFISYAWGNSHKAHKLGSKSGKDALGWEKGDPRNLKDYLTANGVSCWLDIEQTGKKGLFEDISDGIKNADVVIACVSNEYAESKNCMMELRFAACAMEKPVIGVVVGNSDKWRGKEVRMLLDRAEAPMMDFQFVNEAGLEKLLHLVKDCISQSKSENKKLQKKTTGPIGKMLDNVSFVEEYELAQRKFLRHVSILSAKMFTLPYPNLFVLDFYGEKDTKHMDVESRPKSSTGEHGLEKRPSLLKRESKLQQQHSVIGEDNNMDWAENNFCIRLLCEHDGGCHLTDTVIPLATENLKFPVESFILESAAYLGRMYTLLKHSTVRLNFMGTEDGKHFLNFIYKTMQESDNDFSESYIKMRDSVMKTDEDREGVDLGRCYLPTGQIRWLCDNHQKGYRITLLSNDVNVGIGGTELVTDDDRMVKKCIDKLHNLNQTYVTKRGEGKNQRKIVDAFDQEMSSRTYVHTTSETTYTDNQASKSNATEEKNATTTTENQQQKTNTAEPNKSMNNVSTTTPQRPKPVPRRSKSTLVPKDLQSKVKAAGYMMQGSDVSGAKTNSQACVIL